MGQQQLLLLVLGIVIVGLAVVAGIQAFGENQEKANVDAMVLTAMRIGTDAQAKLLQPAIFGGGTPASGQKPTNFQNNHFELSQLGYPTNLLDEYQTTDGVFTIDYSSAQMLVQGVSISTSTNLVCIYLDGPNLDDITTIINPPDGGATCEEPE